MANTAFAQKPSNFNDYLAKLEEMMRKNKGSALYQGYDVEPNAQLLPGKVVNASGLGNQQYNNEVQFDKYSPESISFNAPNVGSSAGTAPTPEPQGQVMGEQTENNLSAQDFFGQIGQAIYAPEQNYSPYNPTQNSSRMPTKQIYPMASMPDGNILWSDGNVRAPQPSYLGEGTSGLSRGLFGSNQAVTQPYGNYNPIEPSPGNINYGTDFRTKDLSNREIKNLFNQPLKVIDIYNQARPGTGGVGNMENSGYGNSILLELADGSRIRVSHFDQLGQFRAGDIINPGETIGVPGATGNVTGQHADVEVYSPDGQIMSPDQFMQQVRQSSTENKPLYQHNNLVGGENNQAGGSAQTTGQPSQIQEGFKLALQDAKNYAQKFKANPVQTVAQPSLNTAQAIGTELKAPELGVGEGVFTPEAEKARTEGISGQYNPYRHLAGNLVEGAGDIAKMVAPGLVKEGVFSEAIAGGPTAHTGQALASEIESNKSQSLPRPTTIGEDFSNIGKDLSQKAQPVVDMVKGLVQKAKDAFGRVTAPGIAQVPSPMQQSPDSIQVGQTSGDQSITAQTPAKSGDTRDPFFKFGGNETYKDYLKPNAEQIQGGALSTNLFNNDFYGNADAVGSVFGKTSQAGEATNLYKENIKSNIKPGFDQPYKEEIVEENGTTYKVLTPIAEYFQNQYWQNQLANTPEKLTADFSYNDYEVPPVADQQNKGEVQSIPTDNPFFKSGAASLFKTAGDKTAQFVKGIGNKISDVYKASPFSKTVSLPEQLKQSISSPAKINFNIPQQSKQVISVNGSNDNRSSGSSNQNQSQPSHNQPAAISRVANYATGNIGKQLSSPQPKPQSKPIYQPFANLQEWMRR